MRVLKSVIATLSFFTLLASCVDDHPGVEIADAPDATGPYAPEELRTLLDKASVDAAFGNDANFRVSASLLGENCSTGTLRSCLNKLQAQNNGRGSDRFSGLGGIPAHAMLEIAGSALKKNGRFNARPKDPKVTGQIRKRCLDDSVGYAYDEGAKTLDLCVRTVTSTNNGAKKVAIEIRIEASNVEHDVKDLSNPQNVFPEAAEATKIKVNFGTAANFQTKLYAAGADISVEDVWVDKNYKEQNPDFERVPETGNKLKKYQALYDSRRDACIDMMFQSNPPPASLGGETKPPFYCLGRCDWPPIINTI